MKEEQRSKSSAPTALDTDFDIIFLGGVDWESIYSLPAHHVVRELSKRHRVFYIDNFGGGRPVRWGDLKRVARKLRGVFQKREHRGGAKFPIVRMPLLIPYPQNRIVALLNGLLLARSIRRIMSRHQLKSTVIWTRIRTDTVATALKHLPKHLLVLQEVDHASESPNIPAKTKARFIASTEEIRRMADLVFTSARGLAELAQEQNSEVHFFPNGVDSKRFSSPRGARPSGLHGIDQPIAIFAGNIAEWVDLELISAAANAVPEAQFVLIGPQRVDVDALRKISNIHFRDAVQFDDLIHYYRWSTVGLVPYRVTPFTKYTFPSKVFEYLAAGLPVVSTALPELTHYEGLVDIGVDPDSFSDAILAAISRAPVTEPPRIIEEALESHSWPKIVSRMEKEIARVRHNQSSNNK